MGVFRIPAEIFVETWAVFLRHLRFNLRMPIWIVVNLTQPMVWLLLYGQLFRRVVELPGFGAGSYIQFLTPGVVTMTALFSSAWAGFGIIEDYDRGVLDRLLTTPIRPGSIILGSVMSTVLTVLFQALLILGLGILLGARVAGGLGGMAVLLLAAALVAAGFSAFSNGVAFLTRKEEPLIAVINFISLPLTFLSEAIMSPRLMPSWMLAAARWNPVNWAVVMAREGMTGGKGWPEALELGAFALAMHLFARGAFAFYRRLS